MVDLRLCMVLMTCLLLIVFVGLFYFVVLFAVFVVCWFDLAGVVCLFVAVYFGSDGCGLIGCFACNSVV